MDDRSRTTTTPAATKNDSTRARARLAGLLVASTLLAVVFAAPRGAAGKPAASNALPRLAGTTWHTRNVEGGPLLFVVKGVGVRFVDDKNFSATVRFVDDQKTTKTGTYAIEDGYVTFVVEGLGKQKARIWSDAGDIVVKDEAYDASARLVRGTMEDSSWF
ncbi:MAG: hypothetical protein ACKO2K_19175 [Alphaproteobacteria bacterium]